MRKRFLEWFIKYGLMGDRTEDQAEYLMVQRACWRAYKRGLKDGKQEVRDYFTNSIISGIQIGD